MRQAGRADLIRDGRGAIAARRQFRPFSELPPYPESGPLVHVNNTSIAAWMAYKVIPNLTLFSKSTISTSTIVRFAVAGTCLRSSKCEDLRNVRSARAL